jgi:hypothetical protein
MDELSECFERWLGDHPMGADIDAKRRILNAYLSDNNAGLYGGCGDDCEWKALGWVLETLMGEHHG